MAEFRIDQATPGPGVAGQARHDLIPGEIITLTATSPTGPGVTYLWEILDKVGSTATLSGTTGVSVTVGPAGQVDEPCSFRVRLTADDNGTVTTIVRPFSVRSPLTGLRVPTFGETAPAAATLASNDPDESEDNALYSNRAGLGAAAQNWRAWAEWAYELVQAIETVAGSASVTLAGDVTGPSGTTVVERIRGYAVLNAAPTAGQVLSWDAVNSRYAPTTLPVAGDVTGTVAASSVVRIRGWDIHTTAPTDGQVLTWVAANNRYENQSPTGYPIAAMHELAAGTNVTADTPDVAFVLGGFVFDPDEYDYATLTYEFRTLATMFSSTASGYIDLYDLGPPGSPIVPVRRCRLYIDAADDGVPVNPIQPLTLSATPGVDLNEILDNVSMYEVRIILESGSPGDLLHVLYAGIRVGGSL